MGDDHYDSTSLGTKLTREERSSRDREFQALKAQPPLRSLKAVTAEAEKRAADKKEQKEYEKQAAQLADQRMRNLKS